jgi:hypothetical protein
MNNSEYFRNKLSPTTLIRFITVALQLEPRNRLLAEYGLAENSGRISNLLAELLQMDCVIRDAV